MRFLPRKLHSRSRSARLQYTKHELATICPGVIKETNLKLCITRVGSVYLREVMVLG